MMFDRYINVPKTLPLYPKLIFNFTIKFYFYCRYVSAIERRNEAFDWYLGDLPSINVVYLLHIVKLSVGLDLLLRYTII